MVLYADRDSKCGVCERPILKGTRIEFVKKYSRKQGKDVNWPVHAIGCAREAGVGSPPQAPAFQTPSMPPPVPTSAASPPTSGATSSASTTAGMSGGSSTRRKLIQLSGWVRIEDVPAVVQAFARAWEAEE